MAIIYQDNWTLSQGDVRFKSIFQLGDYVVGMLVEVWRSGGKPIRCWSETRAPWRLSTSKSVNIF